LQISAARKSYSVGHRHKSHTLNHMTEAGDTYSEFVEKTPAWKLTCYLLLLLNKFKMVTGLFQEIF